MKIKFLLVPLAIILSIVIVIWNIYPAWLDKDSDKSIVVLKSSIETKQNDVDRIKERKKNVGVLYNKLQNDSASRDLVFSYYPTIRKEEDVINKINHIALGTGVFLTNISVEYGRIDSKKNDSSKILSIASNNKGDNSVEQVLLNNVEKDMERTPGFVTAETEIYGEYSQIKDFIYSLYVTGLLNNVQALDLHKEEDAEGGSRLVADVTASFGYLAEKNDQAVNLISDTMFASESLNLEPLNEKKSLMSEKYPNSEVGEQGLVNPFAP